MFNENEIKMLAITANTLCTGVTGFGQYDKMGELFDEVLQPYFTKSESIGFDLPEIKYTDIAKTIHSGTFVKSSDPFSIYTIDFNMLYTTILSSKLPILNGFNFSIFIDKIFNLRKETKRKLIENMSELESIGLDNLQKGLKILLNYIPAYLNYKKILPFNWFKTEAHKMLIHFNKRFSYEGMYILANNVDTIVVYSKNPSKIYEIVKEYDIPLSIHVDHANYFVTGSKCKFLTTDKIKNNNGIHFTYQPKHIKVLSDSAFNINQ